MNKSELCKNCNSKLYGKYCSSCGQKDIDVLDLKVITKDFLKDVFEIDSRVFLTLKNLLINPGLLTKEYWLGKRKKYISPIRLIIVTSFIYFIMVPFLFDETETFMEIDDKSTNQQDKIEFYETIDVRFKSIIISLEKYATLIAIPFLAFILGRLYKKHNLRYLYHIIALLHFCSFEYCLNTISSGLILLFHNYSDLIEVISTIPLVIYLFVMIKNLYEETYLKTLFKSFILILSLVSFVISIMIGYTFIPPGLGLLL